jgi:hypothetical protein
MPPRPKQGRSHERPTQSSSFGPRGDGQTLEISDPEANAGDGKASQASLVASLVDDVPGRCFEALSQARPAQPPSRRESLPIEMIQVLEPVGSLDLDLRAGKVS